ncbi:MAG: histidine phosphatase family protein [Candidatus Dormiibacterota bacterium]
MSPTPGASVNPSRHPTEAAIRAVEERFLVGLPGVTEVWLIRHGECYDDLQDDTDPALSPRGREQVQRLSERLGRLQLDAVYTSPLRRARETAAALSSDVHTDARLVEAMAAMEDGWFRPIEPFETVADRMAAAVDDALTAHPPAGSAPGGRIAIVAHGGSITAYLGRVLRLEAGSRLRVLPFFTSVNIVRARESARAVGTINDVSHLEGLE